MPVTLHWVYKRPSEKGGLWGPPFGHTTPISGQTAIDPGNMRANSVRSLDVSCW